MADAGGLYREPHECFSEIARNYVRVVYEHTVQVIDFVETYRELASGLSEAYMTAISNRMNEIMKVADDHRDDLYPSDLLGRGLMG